MNVTSVWIERVAKDATAVKAKKFHFLKCKTGYTRLDMCHSEIKSFTRIIFFKYF
jgi:hypothetical protein